MFSQNNRTAEAELKEVRFNPQVEVRYIRHWNFAHRQARGGGIELVIDRQRFQRRIQQLEQKLGPLIRTTNNKVNRQEKTYGGKERENIYKNICMYIETKKNTKSNIESAVSVR